MVGSARDGRACPSADGGRIEETFGGVEMSEPYADGSLKPEQIICRKWGESPNVVFVAIIGSRDSSVLVRIGNAEALISREELAAAHALWPPR